jgi:hypothetical protein
MADGGACARIAGTAAFVSMADKGACARIVGAAAFVSMADKGASAMNACCWLPSPPWSRKWQKHWFWEKLENAV